jgi:hypothetical protein
MEKFEKIIQKNKEKALSNREVLNLVNNKANLLLYKDLHNFNNIDEVLGPHQACFLLYESKKNFGHWCCVFKIDNNTIEFFDPYGYFVDDELDFIPENFRKISNQDYPHLSYLLYKSPYMLSYNEHNFQELAKGVNTCGRWCALRMILRNYTLEEFQKIFNKINGDELVTLLTLI